MRALGIIFVLTLIVLGVVLARKSYSANFNFFYKSSLPTPTHKTLKEIVNKTIKDTHGTYAISIKNLKTGEEFNLNENKHFESGSLYKLWVMGEAYREFESGKISKAEVIGPGLQTVNDAINIMINVSDNDSAIELTNRIGFDNLNVYLKMGGFVNSDIGGINEPETSAHDIELFFEKLYKGQLANPASTKDMLDILKSQTLNDMLPKFLPPGTIVAHKTADLGDFVHDAGIIYSPNGDYILVILTQGESPDTVQNVVASISRAVYNYFN